MLRLFSILLFLSSLIIAYDTFVAEYFAYRGFKEVFFFENLFIVIMCISITLPIFPKKLKRACDIILVYNYISLFLPLAVLFIYDTVKASTFLMSVACIIATFLANRISFKSISSPKVKILILRFTIIITMFCLLAYIIGSVGVKNINLSLVSEYTQRDLASRSVKSTFVHYLLPAMNNVLAPALLTLSLLFRKYHLTAIVFTFYTLIFMYTGEKTPLILPIFLTVIYLASKYKISTSKMLVSGTVFVAMCLVAFYVYNIGIIASLFIRRVLFVPALLVSEYEKCFHEQNYVYWSNSVLKNFYTFNLPMNIPNYVGKICHGSGDYANAGFLSMGYAHAGYMGVIIYTVIITIFIITLNTLAKDEKTRLFVVGTSIMPLIIVFSAADLPTTIITHGLGLSILLIWTFKNAFR